jgi:hypothetical protein
LDLDAGIKINRAGELILETEPSTDDDPEAQNPATRRVRKRASAARGISGVGRRRRRRRPERTTAGRHAINQLILTRQPLPSLPG